MLCIIAQKAKAVEWYRVIKLPPKHTRKGYIRGGASRLVMRITVPCRFLHVFSKECRADNSRIIAETAHLNLAGTAVCQWVLFLLHCGADK